MNTKDQQICKKILSEIAVARELVDGVSLEPRKYAALARQMASLDPGGL